MRAISAVFVVLAVALGLCARASAVEVERELLIDAPLNAIWAKIGDPCSLKDWAGVGCTKEEVGGDVVRTLTAPDGAQFIEEIVALGHGFYAYRLIEGPMPISNYIAVMSMVPDAADPSKTLVSWRSNFDVSDADRAAMTAAIGGIYEGTLTALADYMKAP